MNRMVSTYTQKVKDGDIRVCDIPDRIRKDVISLLRELLAIEEALIDKSPRRERSDSAFRAKAA